MGKTYNKDSIYSLAPREFTRHSAGVYAGDTSTSTQLIIEILSNAIDEHRLGHGNVITVIRDNNYFTVTDNGQGFLVNEMREDGETVFQAAFDVMNTSGKYDEDGVYEGTSNGQYGIGDKITNFLSHSLRATTVRDGQKESLVFEEGIFKSRKIEAAAGESSGTTITWNPSEEFFTTPDIDLQKTREYMKQQCAFNPNLSIIFYPEGKLKDKEIYHFPEGLAALITGKETSSRMVINYTEGKYKLDMLLTYTDSWSPNFIAFVNSGITDSGPHISGIKTLFTREFNKFFKTKEWGKEDKLTGDDIQNGMTCIFNITTSGHSYDAQVKTRITKLDMTPFTNVIKEELWYWMEGHEKDLKAIYNKATTAKKARDAEKRVREKIRAAAAPKTHKVKKFDTKLADCDSRNRDECSIIITEGDSASGNLKMIRDRKTIAVMPVRGKILNVAKATLEEIMDNQEIMTMMEAFGLVWDPITLRAKIRPQGLRYGKIVIMADGDVDGERR